MKKIMTMMIIGVLWLSMFPVFVRKIEAVDSRNDYASRSAFPPVTEWNRTYERAGVYDRDDYGRANALVQTDDGGYALAGYTYYSGAGLDDFWLIKTDAYGSMQWNKTYGGTKTDAAHALIQTTDGGYALAGYTDSYGAGDGDFWLVKTDADGSMQWNKTYGTADPECAWALIQTVDGGYALTGVRAIYGTDIGDSWLVKTDADGSMQWNKTYGGTYDDRTFALIQTAEGGYALAGYSYSYGAEDGDFWLVTAYANGTREWDTTYGGEGLDIAYSVLQNADGGYAIGGTRGLFYPETTNCDCWLVKTYPNGTMQWNKTIGGPRNDEAFSMIQTENGGYALAGYTYPMPPGPTSASSVWLVETDSSGIMQWNQTYGTINGNAWACSVVQTTEGAYALADLISESYGSGIYDFWLIKTAYVPLEIDVFSPESTTYYTGSVPLTFDVSEPTSWIGYSLDSQANVTVIGNTTIYAEEGSHQIVVYANDTFGNMEASEPVSFSVEIHDVAVRSVNTSKTGCTPLPVVCQNYTANITAVIENVGIYNETLNLSIYANTTLIETRSVTLTGLNVSTEIFAWNTTGFPKGNYTIIAYAEPVLHETSISDNTLEGDWIIVAWIGDINYDGTVDIKDVYKVCLAFGTSIFPPNPPGRNYNPNSDINNDGKVDVKDLYIVCRHFGEVDP